MSMPERVTEPFLDILEVFWNAPHGIHGYELTKKTKRGRPTIYNNLDRLSKLGWVTNEWENPSLVRGRPLRKVYRLSPDGKRLAEQLLTESGRISDDNLGTASDNCGVGDR